MNDDNIFDAPDPIFKTEDLSDIGAPLTFEDSFTFTQPSGISSDGRGISGTSTNLYLLYRLQGDNFISKYSLCGAIDSNYGTNGRLTIPNPPVPSTLSGYIFAEFLNYTFNIANDKIYLIPRWFSRSTSTNSYSLEVFNLSTGAHESHLYTVPIASTENALAINTNNSILLDNNTVQIRSLTSATVIHTISLRESGISLAANDSRIYTFQIGSSNFFIDVYNTTSPYSEVVADRTNVQFNFGDGMTIAGTTLYLYRDFGSLRTYSGVPLPPPPSITASWGTPIYSPLSRKISSLVTFSAEPTTFMNSAFVVQKNVASVWTTEASGWTITDSMGTTSRTITATPDSTVGAGSYRIHLAENALGTNQPSAAASTSSVTVAAYTAFTSTWASGTPTVADNRSVTISITFSVDPGQVDAEADFEVQRRTSTSPDVWATETDSNWAITSPGTGTTTRMITASPVQAVTAGTYRIRLKEDAFETDYPAAAVASPSFTIGAYVAPVVATAAWSSVIYCSTSGQIQGTMTFTGADITGIESSDFEVLTDADASTMGWTINVPSTASDGTGILVRATAPANTNASFKIRLKMNSVNSGTGTDNAPAANVDTNDIAVDNTAAPPALASGSWSNVVGGQDLSGTLNITGDSVSGIEIGDFAVLDNSDAVATGWTISLPSSFNGSLIDGQNIRVTATPPANTNASFKLRLNALSINSGSGTANAPTMVVDSQAIAVNNTGTQDGRSSYTLTFVVPEGTKGSLQISIPAATFNVSGQLTQRGPRSQQYLGRVVVDYEIVPQLVNVDSPDQLTVGNNDVLLDWNTEVEGVQASAFLIDGVNLTLEDSNIFYRATPDPDISPNAASRNVPIVPGTTKAKYYKLRFPVTAPVPVGNMNLYVKADIINND